MTVHIGIDNRISQDSAHGRHVPTRSDHIAASLHVHRVERLWTAQVAIPLLMIATALTGLWMTWPLLLFLSWWWTPKWTWSWLIALTDGCFGGEWAIVGAMSFAAYPYNFVAVAAVWISLPLLLAVSGHMTRRRVGRYEWQPPI